jgi:hypothetical protein
MGAKQERSFAGAMDAAVDNRIGWMPVARRPSGALSAARRVGAGRPSRLSLEILPNAPACFKLARVSSIILPF